MKKRKRRYQNQAQDLAIGDTVLAILCILFLLGVIGIWMQGGG